MASILIPPRIQFIDKNGEPLVGGKVYTLIAGGGPEDYKTSWKDQKQTVANTNPVELEDDGRAQIWIQGAYKIAVFDKNDVLVYEDDDVISYTDIDFSGLTATVKDLNTTAAQAVFISADYSVLAADRAKLLLVNATTGPVTVTLPDILSLAVLENEHKKYRITIKKIDVSNNAVTIATSAGQQIDDLDEYILYDYADFIEVWADGNDWRIVAAESRGTIITTATDFTVELKDHRHHFNCSASGAEINITLPLISSVGKGFTVSFKKIDSVDNSIYINPAGTDLIDGKDHLIIYATNEFYKIKSDGSNWYIINSYISSGLTTSDVKISFKTSENGFVVMNDGSIGDASSGATTRNRADTKDLFVLLYTNVIDAWAPVSGGRTGNAVNDFNAHKTLTLPRALGRALCEFGAGSGLTPRVLGEYLGEENHQLTIAELATHHHTVIQEAGLGSAYTALAQVVVDNSTNRNTSSVGSDTAHNIMQPSTFMNFLIKL